LLAIEEPEMLIYLKISSLFAKLTLWSQDIIIELLNESFVSLKGFNESKFS